MVDGSLNKPWDLQYALSQSSERMNDGDIICIDEGVYSGNYRSKLESTNTDNYIAVSV